MADTLTITAEARNSHVGRLRVAGNIPSVVYGHGIPSQSIAVESRAFIKLLKKAGRTTMINLVLADKKEHPVFIKDVQYHPVKNNITHVDFLQVRMDETITAKVPLVFTGESPAIKNLSGTLVKNIDELEVEALPKDLPHELTVDISSLADFETVLHVSDIVLPTGIKVLQALDDAVASVQPPRSEAEMDALSEEVKEDVEAVEGVKKEEPAEGEEGAEAKKDSSTGSE